MSVPLSPHVCSVIPLCPVSYTHLDVYKRQIFGNKAEGVLHQCQYVLRLQVTFHQQIITGEAAHGTPIDNLVLPLRVIAQVGGGKMFDSMPVSYTHLDVYKRQVRNYLYHTCATLLYTLFDFLD